MAQSARYERKFLDDGEFDLIRTTRQSELSQMYDGAVRDLVRLLRERRNRARDITSRQRREQRKKAAPAGARPATGNAGSRRKLDIFAAALKRTNKELARRNAKSAKTELIANARKALAMKSKADAERKKPTRRTADKGMRPHADSANRSAENIHEGSFTPQFHQSRGDR